MSRTLTFFVKGIFYSCPGSFLVFICSAVIGIGHCAWVLYSSPVAPFSEVIGVNTFWFAPWLIMGMTFLLMWADGVKTLASARRTSSIKREFNS